MRAQCVITKGEIPQAEHSGRAEKLLILAVNLLVELKTLLCLAVNVLVELTKRLILAVNVLFELKKHLILAVNVVELEKRLF